MATRRAGLDDVQLTGLRAQLAEGKTPRVGVSGPQFPEGTNGQIVRIGDPAVDGAEFITVRVKVDRMVDELQFAPGELTSSVPGATPARPTPKAATSKPSPVGKPAAPKRATAPARPATAPATAPATSPARTVAAAASSKPTSVSKTEGSRTSASKASTSKRRPGAARPVTITIASSGADWSVTVQRGPKTIVKQQPVTPGAVSALAKLVNNAELTEAIADINDAARAEAEEKAARLRAELNALEAVLAAHKAPR